MPAALNPARQVWTEPEISPKNPTSGDMGKTWRVRFRFYESGEWHPISRSFELNSISNFKERFEAAKDLKKILRKELADKGWNPVLGTYSVPEEPLSDVDKELARIKLLGFNDALDYALEKKKKDLAPKSYQDFKTKVKYLKEAAISLKIDLKKMSDLELPHFLLILQKTKEIRGFSNKGFNTYRDYLSSLVTEMIQWQIVKENRVYDVQLKKVVKTVAHRPPTQDEKILIVSQIRQRHIFYFRFICILYGCTIRPKEITRLKIKDLIRDEQIFRIIPDLAEGNSKTLTERDVAIPDWLMNILMEMNLYRYPADWYIFSSKGKMGAFTPGPKAMHPNGPHTTWRRLIKDPPNDNGTGGLGLNVDQYGLKKLSGNDMVKIQRLAGTDRLLELPAAQMGHSSTRMTEIYVDEHLKEMREVVKRDMPALWKA